jgi:hypothetical protein
MFGTFRNTQTLMSTDVHVATTRGEVVRTCEKCGKANQPTRKFCIRCGASLIKKELPKAPAPAPAATPTPEAPPTPEVQPTKPASTTTDDKWVKPSEVSKDRVRVASSSRGKSELEKAREAFAKAETVGIDEEDGSGVVESRMLRASEVRELLEGPGMMAGEEVPPPTMMEGSEPLPPEAVEMTKPSMPTSSQIEESILGSKSAYVDKPAAPTPAPTPTPEPIVLEATTVSPEGEEFTSSRYETESAGEEAAKTGFSPHTTPVKEVPPAKIAGEYDDEIDLVIACPDCGKTINVDMFEYPSEVYSLMGQARLKQARFFVVQGKNNDALRILRMTHALFTKASDKNGLAEVKKIIETLAKKP